MNIAPGPNGDYDAVVYERLKKFLVGWILIKQLFMQQEV
jgi:alpha-L-fucosidase